MQNNTWTEYVAAIAEGDLAQEIALRVGVSGSTVSRWGSGARPQAEAVVQFARAYNVSPITALIAAGYLTEEDAATVGERPRGLQLRDFSDLELAKEAVRRIEGDGESTLLEQPLGGDHPAMANVRPIRADVTGLDEDQLRERYDGNVAANTDKSDERLDDSTP